VTFDWPLWRRWTAAVTAGELIGFIAPAVAGAMTAAAGVGAGWTYVALLVAGSVEGYCLGYSQAWVLASRLVRLPRQAFAAATSAAAVVAYAIGMLPSSLGDRIGTMSLPLTIGLAAVGAVVLLASIGSAQWLVLRRVGYEGRWWVIATAAAWLAGLTVFLVVATPLWHPGQVVWQIVAIGILGGAAMAATVAAVTGFAAVRLTRQTAMAPGGASAPGH
jgi:hypothetical protein